MRAAFGACLNKIRCEWAVTRQLTLLLYYICPPLDLPRSLCPPAELSDSRSRIRWERIFVGKLILVRHGHTPLNGDNQNERLRSWLDIPLDQQGLDEALKIAQSLASLPVSTIVSSDLRRAYQTAETIRALTGATLETTEALRPWNLGIFAGQLISEVVPFLDMLNHSPDLMAPNGESYRQFYDRYSRCLMELLNRAEETPGYTVAVTHVRNFLALKSVLTHGSLDRIPVQGGPCTGALRFIERAGDKWLIREDVVKLAPPAATLTSAMPEDDVIQAN